MTKSAPPKMPKPPYEKTYLPGGPLKIVQIAEALRTLNHDGYLPGVGGLLAKFRWPPGLPTPPECYGTTCSPFTATVIGCAFDPNFPRADGDPYVPLFNGDKKDELMPFYTFYGDHNRNDFAIGSIEKYNLGRELKDADWWNVRRGDLVEISWWPGGGGHAVFCWDVHLDAKGKVDAIQILGSNGPVGGVSIHGCLGKPWLKGSNADYTVKIEEYEDPKEKDEKKRKKKRTKVTLNKRGDYVKLQDMFVDDKLIVQRGQWYALPGVPKDSIDLKTFLYEPVNPIKYARTVAYSLKNVRFGRFHYQGEPPKPFCMKNGASSSASPSPSPASSPKPSPPGHVTAPAVAVKAAEIKKDPEAPKKVPTQPAKQDKDKPVRWQLFVEHALQAFHHARWLENDPGDSDNLNDDKSQKAIKEFQEKFNLKKDGIVGEHTLGAIQKQLPACATEASTQLMLRDLFRGKKLDTDPGAVDGINHDETKAAVQSFQSANGLEVTGLPDADTLAKLIEVHKSYQASPDKPGVSPELHHLYWVGNNVDPGGTARLRLHSRDLIIGQECAIRLHDPSTGKEVECSTPMKVDKSQAEASFAIPKDFPGGSLVHACVVAKVDDGELEAHTSAPLKVNGSGWPETEAADWRPYIGKDSVPDEVLDAIKRNRARYAERRLVLVTGKYAGDYHYDYKPPASHAKWAKEYFKKKVDAAGPSEKQIPAAFVVMLDAEGRPASMQTYDNQIVTWGVGLGAKGDGVHAFTELNKDPKAKKLLDDLGINYEKFDYHVVDLKEKKVISSSAGKPGNDNRHIPPLKSWRQQTDLLSAIIGISEDPATREPVAESQYAVYLSNSTRWPGKDKVLTGALFFMIVHLHHWMPALAKYGFNVEEIFKSLGADKPSLETDKKLALQVARGFVKEAKAYFITRQSDKNKYKDTYDDIHTRTRTRVWAKLKEDGKAEGFDPGELTYDE